MAASVEMDSEHPLARAIVRGSQQRGISAQPATDFQALPGRGAQANVGGREVSVGGPRLLADLDVEPPAELRARADGWAGEGRTVLFVVADRGVLGALALEDEIRAESIEAVQQLHQMGLQVAMITGDAQAVADSVARRIGIDEVAAQVLPADKADAVKNFQAGGKRVAMVGDGVTMRRRWHRPTLGSPLAPEPTSPLSRLASSWCATIRATSSERSRYRAPATSR